MRDQHIYTYEIPVRELADCEPEVLRVLGEAQMRSRPEIRPMIQDLTLKSADVMAVRGGYRLLMNNEIKVLDDSVVCGEVEFKSRSTIAGQLQNSTSLALFAVTLGPGFDTWSADFFVNNDPFSAYMADLIGSIRTEQAADWLGSQLDAQMAAHNLRCTNRFSPGYCGWEVSEQHKLFSFFPERFLGLTLNASSLMTPLKSISGLIGIGKTVERLPHTCEFCDFEDCYMRR